MSEATEPVEAKRPAAKTGWVGWLSLVAILGIIAAVAIPQYADYTHRSQNSEAITLMLSARTPLAEYFVKHEKWPENLAQVFEHTSGKYTESVAITRGAGGAGEIEVTATMRTERVDRRVAGTTVLVASSDGGRTWTCKPGTMQVKYLPSSCRPK